MTSGLGQAYDLVAGLILSNEVVGVTAIAVRLHQQLGDDLSEWRRQSSVNSQHQGLHACKQA